MKFSLNHIRHYNQLFESAGDPAADGVERLLERIGARLGGVEEVEYLRDKYQGAVIAKVVSCVDHPDSDHMHVCVIDDGGAAQDVPRDENGHVQVVCGAPNVREGITVVWLPPGTTVPESYSTAEPFVLGARQLRGVTSNGMLASARELGLGDNHDGILEITDDDAKPGDAFGDIYGLTDDVIIDIENKMFTHRPDCFGYFGIARELAGIQGQAYKSAPWYRQDAAIPAPEADSLPLTVKNEVPDVVPRFVMVAMSNIDVQPSPTWLQTVLARVGSRLINNIVDYTNYFMLETGQPLHAYDYDKVKALSGDDSASIVVRYPRKGETVTLLNGKTVEPRDEAIVIATDKQAIALAAVMGGADTEVDENTKNIILECGSFDMYSVRRTSMAHGVFTDAVTRFSKGQSPLQNMAVLAKIVDEIRTYAGGKVASEVFDSSTVDGKTSVHEPVTVSPAFINRRLGFDLSAEQMRTLLENVEFKVEVAADGAFTVTAPFWRTDIEIPEDVIEEVGRLHGFEELPQVLPQRSIRPTARNAAFDLKEKLRSLLASFGANEVLTYSFVHGDTLSKAGQDAADAFQLSNALSPDLQYYRLSLTPSLLANIHPNLKAGYDRFVLFEIGKAHAVDQVSKEDGLPVETELLEVVYAENDKHARRGAAYYQARKFLDALAASLGLAAEYRPLDAEPSYSLAKPYDYKRSAGIFLRGDDQPVGLIGEYTASVRRGFKLPAHCAGFSLDITRLAAALGDGRRPYRALSKFPKTTQDVTLKVPGSLASSVLTGCVEAAVTERLAPSEQAVVRIIDIYQGNDTATKNITYSLEIVSTDKTMTDTEVAKIISYVVAAAEKACKAEQV